MLTLVPGQGRLVSHRKCKYFSSSSGNFDELRDRSGSDFVSVMGFQHNVFLLILVLFQTVKDRQKSIWPILL